MGPSGTPTGGKPGSVTYDIPSRIFDPFSERGCEIHLLLVKYGYGVLGFPGDHFGLHRVDLMFPHGYLAGLGETEGGFLQHGPDPCWW